MAVVVQAYDAYLFDWDGTLARTAEIWLEEIKRELAAEGIAISDAENARRLGSFDWFDELGLPEGAATALTDRIIAAASRRFPEAVLYDTAAHLLAALHGADKKLGLVTSTWSDTLDLAMGRHHIRELFDVVITGQDVKHLKPDPEGILMALESLRIQPAKAIMLGDTRKDILAAHNAGIHSALFYPEAHQLIYDLEELQSYQPTHTIRHWQELADQLH